MVLPTPFLLPGGQTGAHHWAVMVVVGNPREVPVEGTARKVPAAGNQKLGNPSQRQVPVAGNPSPSEGTARRVPIEDKQELGNPSQVKGASRNVLLENPHPQGTPKVLPESSQFTTKNVFLESPKVIPVMPKVTTRAIF